MSAFVPQLPEEAASPTPEPAAEGQISLPLESVIKNLPDRLKSTIAKVPSAAAKIDFPAALLLPQIAKGSVKVKFSELMAAAPAGTFSPLPGSEDEAIELPLALVVAQMGSGAFKRRSAKPAPTVEPQDFFGANRKAASPASSPAPESPAPPMAAAASPPVPVFAPAIPAAPASSPAPTVPPSPGPRVPARVPEPPPGAPPAAPGMAAISLAAIIKALPDDLKAVAPVDPPANAFAELPVDLLMPQLAKGKITIPLSQLAAASAPGIFTVLPGNEDAPIPIPLGEVLAKVGPGALKRKAAATALPTLEQQNFFGGQSSVPATPAPASPTAVPAFQPAAPAPSFTPNLAPDFAPATSVPSTPPAPPEPTAPAPQFVPAPPPAEPTAAPAGSTEAGAATEVVIPLTKLGTTWPDALKSELDHLSPESVVIFPAEELGHSLKSGKVRFTWSQIRRWLKPKTNFGGTSWENTELDIPLKAIVGPFMAAMRGQPQTTRVPKAASSPAPATFGAAGEKTAAPAVPYVPPSFTPRVASAVAPAPPAAPTSFFQPAEVSGTPGLSGVPKPMDGPVEMPAPAAPPTPSQLGSILGQPGKDHWTPVEIVQAISGLRETSGAMISLAEGQIAASQIAGKINAELLAFRIPRLFLTNAEQVRELLDQPMSYFSFSADGTPWIVFKLGNIFFTVQGSAGESLPVTKLQSVALEIGRQRR